jgi:hypothetical protein
MARTRLGNSPLAVLALTLAAAFVVLPRPFAAAVSGRDYGDEQHLRVTVTAAFVDYWQTGRRLLTTELSHLVDYWRWYHVLKAATAIGLMVVLVVLASRLWRAFAGSAPRAQARRLATAGVVVTVLAVVAFVAAMANLQGTIAPFSSLMSMLPITSAQGDLTVMIGQVKAQLSHYPSGSSGALQQMVHDLAVYHVVIAVISGTAAAALIGLVVVSFRAYAGTRRVDRRARRLFRGLGSAALVMGVLLGLLALGNTSAVIDSPTAVLNFYRGTF